jgi:integrase
MSIQERSIVNPEHKGMVMKAKYYRHRKNRWVVVLWWQGKQHRRFHYDDRRTPLEAEAMARRLAERINADIEEKGANFDPRQWFRTAGDEFQFEAYASKWLDRQKHLAPSYVKDVKRYVNEYWLPHFGKKDIRQIRAGDIQDLRHSLPDHLKDKSKKNIVDALHVLFVDAYNREDILRIPPFPTIRFQEPEIQWINEEWQDRVIKAIPENDRPIFEFIRFYGVRPGEARALKWDCVDFDNKIITIKRTFSARVLREVTKAKSIKYLPLLPEMEELLKSIRGIAGIVFRNNYGRPYTGKIRLIWNKARDSVGAPKVTLYQGTRHSCGTQLIEAGNPLEVVQKLLGTSART